MVEAYIDFTEEDTEALDRAAVAAERCRRSRNGRTARSPCSRVSPRARQFAEAMLVGPRNAGKTTLFKRLVPGSLALVSPIPGTTRDLLDGVVATEPFRVWDGLGVGEAVDQLEQQAIARAIAFLGGSISRWWCSTRACRPIRSSATSSTSRSPTGRGGWCRRTSTTGRIPRRSLRRARSRAAASCSPRKFLTPSSATRLPPSSR
ncbi:MAG: GTPase [Planctomycetota bacterium]